MPPRQQRAIQKPSNVKDTIKRIFSYMHGFKLHFVFVVVGVVFSAFAGIAGNYLLKPLIDNIEEALRTGTWNKAKFAGILGAMACVYIIGALSSFMYARIMMRISTTTLMRIRNDLFTKMESLPIRFFDKHTHGELMSL